MSLLEETWALMVGPANGKGIVLWTVVFWSVGWWVQRVRDRRRARRSRSRVLEGGIPVLRRVQISSGGSTEAGVSAPRKDTGTEVGEGLAQGVYPPRVEAPVEELRKWAAKGGDQGSGGGGE